MRGQSYLPPTFPLLPIPNDEGAESSLLVTNPIPSRKSMPPRIRPTCPPQTPPQTKEQRQPISVKGLGGLYATPPTTAFASLPSIPLSSVLGALYFNTKALLRRRLVKPSASLSLTILFFTSKACKWQRASSISVKTSPRTTPPARGGRGMQRGKTKEAN